MARPNAGTGRPNHPGCTRETPRDRRGHQGRVGALVVWSGVIAGGRLVIWRSQPHRWRAARTRLGRASSTGPEPVRGRSASASSSSEESSFDVSPDGVPVSPWAGGIVKTSRLPRRGRNREARDHRKTPSRRDGNGREIVVRDCRAQSGTHLVPIFGERKESMVTIDSKTLWNQLCLVHTVSQQSSKSVLIPPTYKELMSLAQRARQHRSKTGCQKDQIAPVRGLRRRLAPQVIAALVARYQAGESTPALSQEYGISKAGLLDLLRSEGVPMRRRAITPDDADQAAQLYERGLTIEQVRKKIGYSYGAIRRALHDKGVVLRPAGSRKHPGANRSA